MSVGIPCGHLAENKIIRFQRFLFVRTIYNNQVKKSMSHVQEFMPFLFRLELVLFCVFLIDYVAFAILKGFDVQGSLVRLSL